MSNFVELGRETSRLSPFPLITVRFRVKFRAQEGVNAFVIRIQRHQVSQHVRINFQKEAISKLVPNPNEKKVHLDISKGSVECGLT